MEEHLHTGREPGNHFWCWEHALPIVTVGTRPNQVRSAGGSQSYEPRRRLCGPFERGVMGPCGGKYHRVPYRVCLHSRESEAVAKVKQSPVQYSPRFLPDVTLCVQRKKCRVEPYRITVAKVKLSRVKLLSYHSKRQFIHKNWSQMNTRIGCPS